MTTTLPNDEQIIQSLLDIQSSMTGQCQCEEAPDFHGMDCPSFVMVRLVVTDEDWALRQGEEPLPDEEEAMVVTSTVSRADDEYTLVEVAEQLLTDLDIELASTEEDWV